MAGQVTGTDPRGPTLMGVQGMTPWATIQTEPCTPRSGPVCRAAPMQLPAPNPQLPQSIGISSVFAITFLYLFISGG